mmetsp:Transcript_6132/g.14003  ORF Transcript_6132/g.14003 Transcript_6132/m.14003 type:complete len:172 (+) Transcript_6132:99-614(+)
MGSAMSSGPDFVQGANGPLRRGDRVQTQYTIEEGGDGRWYRGTITRLYNNNQAKIKYDDGDVWKGASMYIWSLSGPPPANQAQARPAMPAVQATVVQGTVVGGTVYLPEIPPSEAAFGNEPCCPVCNENKLDMAIQCGHRLCGTCLRGIHQRSAPCPVCRTPISQVIRIYN